MLEEIYDLASAFLGLTGEDGALRAACKAAEAELSARLRVGISPTDCHDSFVCAAAWIAVAGYHAAGKLGDVRAFSMADLSVTKSDSGASANVLRTQAETLMAPFCRDAFQFRGVRS